MGDGNFTAGIARDPDLQDDEVVLEKSLPPLWKGQYQGHFIPIAEVMALDQDVRLRDLEVSHLAMLESFDYGKDDPISFGNEAVTHNGMVVWFSEKRKKFYAIHCRGCAFKLIEWLLQKQDKWHAEPTAGRA